MAQQAKTQFEHYFKKMSIPRFVIKQEGDDYIVAQANNLILKYFDLNEEQLIGHKIQDFMDHESISHFKQSFEVCYEKKRPVTIQALPGVPSAVRIYNFYITPVMDEQGDIEFLDVIGQLDVSDQSALQRERDDAVSMMTSIFDVSEVGIIITDQKGRIIRVNDTFIREYGWPRDELINADIASLATPEERELVKKNHNEFARTGVRSSGELKMVRKNGSIAHALFTTATMDLSQKRRFQVTTVMDITLRKQMEETLRHAKDQADNANRAKSTFLANMSHELRTPLNAIIGFSEMMMKETFGPLGNEKYTEYMEDVHTSARHLLEIINEVLDMSKIEAGRLELDESEMDIEDVLVSVTRMLASRAFGSDLEMKIDIHEEFPNLYGDQKLIRQICINLITNAVKFSPQGGVIDIAAAELDDGRLQISVSDKGPGIAKEKIKQAMEPFGQVSDRDESSNRQGTGLGLPLAKAMIELHDGTMYLESELGRGTTVFVLFPAYRRIPKNKPMAAEYEYSNKDDPDLALPEE